MSAAKIPDVNVPIARTDADWSFDIAFRDEDWTGRAVSVVFARQGLPATVFEVSVGNGVLTPATDLAVALRVPAEVWADKPPGRYSAQVRGIADDEIDDAAVFTVTLAKGLSDLVSAPAPAAAPQGDGLAATGGVIVNRAGRVEIVRSAGAAGWKGWSPILATDDATDPPRRLMKVVDWSGGGGDRPAVGAWVGNSGLVDDPAEAADFAGVATAEVVAATAAALDVVEAGASILAAKDEAVDSASAADAHRVSAQAARDDIQDVKAIVGYATSTQTGYVRVDLDPLGNVAAGLKANGVSHFAEVEVGRGSLAAGFSRDGDGPLVVNAPTGFRPAPGVTVTTRDLTGTEWEGAVELHCDPSGWVVRAVYADGRTYSTETGGAPASSIGLGTITALPNSNNPPPNGGFTCTGLDKFPASAQFAFCPIVGNDGRSPGSSTFYSGLLLLTPDYRVRVREYQFGPGGGVDFAGLQSVQFVCVDTSDNTVWFCDKTNKKARHIALTDAAPYYTKLTDEITAPVSPLTGAQMTLNCGAYYPPSDALMLMNEGQAELVLSSCADGSILRSWTNGGLRPDFDQMCFDPTSGLCAFTYGGNGSNGKIAIWDPEGNGGAGELVHTFSVEMQAIEGVWMRLGPALSGPADSLMDGSFHTDAKPPLALAMNFNITIKR